MGLQTLSVAQSSVSGVVLNVENQAPLEGATVQSISNGQGTITDEYGRFRIEASDSLLISYLGFEPLRVAIEPGTDLTLRLRPRAQEIQQVVINALEGKKRLIETPAAIARLTTQEIDRFLLVSPQQTFSTLPGVKIESTTIGRYRVRIRGGNLGIVGHSDNYKSYWNGIPITFADGFSPLAYFDFGSVGAANVIRGPSGSIYGAGLSGVVLFENKAPSYRETSLAVDGLLGSFGTHRYGMTFQSGGDKGDIRLGYANVHTDGYREEAFSDNAFINLSARLFPSDKQAVSIIAQFMDRAYGIPGNIDADRVKENPRQPNFAPELDNGVVGRNLLIGMAHDYRFNDRWENTTSFSYQVYEGTFLIGNDFFQVADQSLIPSFSLRTSTAYRFQAFGGYDARFVFGGEFTRGVNEVDEFTEGFNSPIFSSRNSLDRSLLAFGQLEFDLPWDLNLTLGGSFNNFYLEFEERLAETPVPQFDREVNDFSPRIALVKKINDRLFLFGNIAKGFTPPPRGAIDNDGENVNADLQSTTGWNKEVGLRGRFFEDRFQFDLVVYRLDETNVIVPRVASNIGGIDRIRNENAGAIDRQGVELGVQYFLANDPAKPISLARFWSSYTYMDHRFESYNTIAIDDSNNPSEVNFDGNKIPGVHPHTVVLGFDVATRPGFYLNTTYSYFGEIYLNNANTVTDDAYQLWDSRLGLRRALGRRFQLDVYGGVNNLLDDDYSSMHALNASFGAFFDPAPGRNYYGGLTLKYLIR